MGTKTRRAILTFIGLVVVLGPAQIAAAEGKAKHRMKGLASWYGDKFHKKSTASGEKFDMNALTAAHRTLPFGTWVKVTTVEKKPRSVTVRINDRGPWKKARVIDVSKAAARRLGLVKRGMGQVTLVVVKGPKKS